MRPHAQQVAKLSTYARLLFPHYHRIYSQRAHNCYCPQSTGKAFLSQRTNKMLFDQVKVAPASPCDRELEKALH